MAAQKNDGMLEYIQNMDASEILPGVAEYLQSLHGRGVKNCLGQRLQNSPLILNRLGISSLFDVIVDGNKVVQAKPSPSVPARCPGIGYPAGQLHRI